MHIGEADCPEACAEQNTSCAISTNRKLDSCQGQYMLQAKGREHFDATSKTKCQCHFDSSTCSHTLNEKYNICVYFGYICKFVATLLKKT